MCVLGYSEGLSLCTRVSHVCAGVQWGLSLCTRVSHMCAGVQWRTVSVYQGESCVCWDTVEDCLCVPG